MAVVDGQLLVHERDGLQGVGARRLIGRGTRPAPANNGELDELAGLECQPPKGPCVRDEAADVLGEDAERDEPGSGWQSGGGIAVDARIEPQQVERQLRVVLDAEQHPEFHVTVRANELAIVEAGGAAKSSVASVTRPRRSPSRSACGPSILHPTDATTSRNVRGHGVARIIAAVCEHYVARASEPFPIDELWPFTERLERFGMAGFGWGAAWLALDGRLASHRDVRAFRDDQAGAERVGAQETTSLLVHVRRPSKLSTLQLADTQPFADPGGRFAFSHNGDLREIGDARRRFQAEGRIAGRADTEVGARWLEDAWDDCPTPAAALHELHGVFGGNANLATLGRDGTVVHYAGNTENPVFTFRLGRIGVASTSLYSIDRSLFQLAATGATERRLVRPGLAVTLAADGSPSVA